MNSKQLKKSDEQILSELNQNRNKFDAWLIRVEEVKYLVNVECRKIKNEDDLYGDYIRLKLMVLKSHLKQSIDTLKEMNKDIRETYHTIKHYDE